MNKSKCTSKKFRILDLPIEIFHVITSHIYAHISSFINMHFVCRKMRRLLLKLSTNSVNMILPFSKSEKLNCIKRAPIKVYIIYDIMTKLRTSLLYEQNMYVKIFWDPIRPSFEYRQANKALGMCILSFNVHSIIDEQRMINCNYTPVVPIDKYITILTKHICEIVSCFTIKIYNAKSIYPLYEIKFNEIVRAYLTAKNRDFITFGYLPTKGSSISFQWI